MLANIPEIAYNHKMMSKAARQGGMMKAAKRKMMKDKEVNKMASSMY